MNYGVARHSQYEEPSLSNPSCQGLDRYVGFGNTRVTKRRSAMLQRPRRSDSSVRSFWRNNYKRW